MLHTVYAVRHKYLYLVVGYQYVEIALRDIMIAIFPPNW